LRFQPPAAIPIVESVPVAASPVLLSQDRYLVSTTRLRAIEVPELRTAGEERICGSSGLRQGALPATEQRLNDLQDQINRLVQVVSDLKDVVKSNQGLE